MSLKEYLGDRSVFLLLHASFFVFASTLLLLIGTASALLVLFFCSWFVPLVAYIAAEFIRQRKYFTELDRLTDSLDQKYLLAEMMGTPERAEEEFLHDLLRRINKDMHEHVKNYRDRESDYREYIETWVHEIKTPIASTRLIIENNRNEVTRNIGDELRRVEEYIDQVLYYSRSNHVSQDYLIREVALADLVRNAVKRNSRDFISKGITVDLEGVGGDVYCDPKWLEFILNQLIGNAVKYSRNQDGRVRFRSERHGNEIVLTVADNGTGISGKDLNRVFDKGFTGENGRKYGRSTGIGLYLCKKLAEQLGLGISLASEEGQGTEVRLAFPLKRA